MTPGTMLVVTFATLTVALFALFWGGSRFLQAYVYNEPANKLAIRGLIAGLLVGGFLTFWVFVNTRAESKDRYGTFFEFNPTSSHPFDSFEAVRRGGTKDDKGQYRETTAAFKKQGDRYLDTKDTTKSFNMTTADYVVVAVAVKDGEKAVRYDADLDATGKYKSGSNRLFKEVGGRRYIEFGQSNNPSAVFAPSRGALWAALGLNLLHYAVWTLVLWAVLRFTPGHAFGLAVALGLPTMLLLMPLLFDKNKMPDSFGKPVAAQAK